MREEHSGRVSTVSSIPTSGEWREERLYVLKTIEDLKQEQRRALEAAAVERSAMAVERKTAIEKGARDIKAAHDKIRTLETTDSASRLKLWIMTTLLSVAGAIAFEVLRAWLHGSKP